MNGNGINRLKYLFTFIITLTSFNIYAASQQITRQDYWGTDLVLFAIKKTEDFSPLLSNNTQGVNLFYGRQFNSPFFLEGGVYWTNRDAKPIAVKVGDKVLGVTATQDATHKTKVRYKSTHVDLGVNFTDNMSVALLFGVGFVKQSIVFQHAPRVEGTQIYDSLELIRSKTKAIARVGIKLQHLFDNNVAVRLIGRWENMSKARIRIEDPGLNINPKMFKHALNASLGFAYYF